LRYLVPLLLLTIASCQGVTREEEWVTVVGEPAWRLVWLRGVVPFSYAPIVATFEPDGTLHGHAEHPFQARFARDRGKMTITSVEASRDIVGPPSVIAQEHAFLEALPAIDGWRTDSRGRLELLRGARVLLRFER